MPPTCANANQEQQTKMRTEAAVKKMAAAKGTVGDPVPVTGRHSPPKQDEEPSDTTTTTTYHVTYTDTIEADSLEEAEHKLLAVLECDVHEGDIEAFEITPRPQGYNPAPIDPMTDETPNINNHTWSDLFSYDFEVYPDDLVVTTTANPDEFAEAVTHEAILRHHGHGGSIETVLRNLGHAAVTGRRVDDDGRSV